MPSNADQAWLAGIEVVATDLAESFRAGLSPHLDDTRRVAEPFHVVRVGNRCVDASADGAEQNPRPPRPQSRSAVPDPQSLLTGSDRLDQRGSERMLLGLPVGDPHDEYSVPDWPRSRARDVYLADTPADLRRHCSTRPSSAAQPTRWPRFVRSATHSPPGAPRSRPSRHPPPPTDPLKASTSTYEGQALRPRLPIMGAGGITWPERLRPPCIRTRSPHSDA